MDIYRWIWVIGLCEVCLDRTFETWIAKADSSDSSHVGLADGGAFKVKPDVGDFLGFCLACAFRLQSMPAGWQALGQLLPQPAPLLPLHYYIKLQHLCKERKESASLLLPRPAR